MTKKDDERSREVEEDVVEEREFFPHCDCDRCNQLSDLLEHIVPLMEDASNKALDIEAHSEKESDLSVAFVLVTMVAIMRNLFSGDIMGMKTAAASAAALNDFINREVSVFCTKHATVDVIIKGLRTMRDMSLPMLSMSAEEAPEGLMEAISAIIAKRGGGPQNLH